MLFLICSYFLPIFLKTFNDTVMIYNTRNRSNDTAESQKEKEPVLMLISIQLKITFMSQHCVCEHEQVF